MPYCHKCGKEFKTQLGLLNHLNSFHGGEV